MEHKLGPSSLEATLEEYGLQPNIRWMKIGCNDIPPTHHHLMMVLFNDGTVAVEFPENVFWLGAIAYAHVGYEK